VNLEGKPSPDELKRELSKAGRGLWNVAKVEQKPEKGRPDIAFYAVDALLHCFDWFKGLPSNEQQKDDVQFAIISTLNALERDAKTKARKLQLAFKLLTDVRLEKLRPRLFEQLLDHTCMLS